MNRENDLVIEYDDPLDAIEQSMTGPVALVVSEDRSFTLGVWERGEDRDVWYSVLFPEDGSLVFEIEDVDHTYGEFFDGASVQRERHVVASWRRKALQTEFLGAGAGLSLGEDEAILLLVEAMRKVVDESSFEELLRRVRAA
jgi:hypothetical protein